MKKIYKYTALFGLAILLTASLHAQSAIAYGDNVTTTMQTLGEIDTFTFNGQNGDRITCRAGFSNSNFDIKIDIVNPIGVIIATNTGFGGYARIDFLSLSENGIYKIIIKDNEGNFSGGTYGVSLQKLNSPSLPPIPYNTNQAYLGIAYGEIRVITFNGQAGERIVFRASSFTSNMDAQVEVYSPDGQLVASDFNAGGYARVDTVLQQSGLFTVLIMDKEGDYSYNQGEYGISLQKLNSPSLPPIPYNTNQAYLGIAYGEIRAITFNGQAGERIVFRASSSNSNMGTQVEVYSPDGQLVVSDFNTGGYARVDTVLQQSGLFTVLIMDKEGNYSYNQHQYGISLQKLNSPSLPPITYNTNQAYLGIAYGEIRVITFNGQAGERIVFRASSFTSNMDAQVEVYSPDGQLVASDFNAGGYARVDTVLQQSGLFTVLIMDKEGDYSYNQDEYGISLQKLNSPSLPPIPYNTNQAYLGIAYGEIRAITFNGQAGERIVFRASSSNSNMGAQVEVYSPDGQLVVSDFNTGGYARVDTVLQQSGLFTVLIMDKEGNYSYNQHQYGISLQKLNSPSLPPIPYNTNQAYLGIAYGEIRAITFNGQAGERIVFRASSFTSNMDAQVEVYSPDGQLVASDFNAGGYARVDTVLQQSGLFTVLIMDKEGDYSYSQDKYGISLQKTSNAPNATPLLGVVNATINKNGQIEAYVLQGNQGDTINIYISTEFSPVEPRIELYNLNGGLIGFDEADETSYVSNIILPETGAFVLLAMDKTGIKTGDYELGLSGSSIQSISFDTWHPFTTNIQSPFDGIVNVPSVSRLFVLLKKSNGSLSYPWNGRIEVIKDGDLVAKETGSTDYDLQLPPQSGSYTLKIIANQTGSGFVKITDHLDNLDLNEWKVDTILRTYGYDWHEVNVPSGQDTLHFRVEGFGISNSLEIFKDTIGATANWIFQSNGQTNVVGAIPNPSVGKYYLRYKDAHGVVNAPIIQYLIQTSSQIISSSSGAISISSLSTYQSGKTGVLTVQIWGADLDTMTAIYLKRTGFSNIYASYVKMIAQGSILATFVFNNMAVGLWEFKAANNGNQEATAPYLFTIVDSSIVDLKVLIIGKSQIRVGRDNTYVVKIQNNGNINALGVVCHIIGGNKLTKFEIMHNIHTSKQNFIDTLPDYGYSDTTKTYSLYFPIISPGRDVEVFFTIKANSIQENYIRIYLDKPMFVLDTLNPFTLSMGQIGKSGWSDCLIKTVDFYEHDECLFAISKYFFGLADLIPTPDQTCASAFFDMFCNMAVDGIKLANEQNFSNWQEFLLDRYNPDFLQSCGVTFSDFFQNLKDNIDEFNLWKGVYDNLISVSQNCGNLDWLQDFLIPFFSVGALDPEDKYGVSGYGQERYVRKNQRLDYQLEIWNDENATANIQTLSILDTLNVNFDLNTFEFQQFGFLRWEVPMASRYYFNSTVDMRPNFDLLVEAEGQLDTTSRVISLSFRSIDPATGNLPDDPIAGFLPPIDTTGYQKAWIDYSVMPYPNLTTGTQITNQAFVEYDSLGIWNTAPKDAPYLNTIDADAPTSFISALSPTSNSDTIILILNGSDIGSGVKGYFIYVSKNGAPFEIHHSVENIQVDTFIGEKGKSYAFYSIARDNVGNIEDAPSSPDATTSILVSNNEISKSTDVKIYPNPTRDKVIIEYKSNEFLMTSLKVVSLNGTTLKKIELPNFENDVFEFDISNLSPGLYFIEFQNGNSVFTRKISKAQ